MTYAIEPVFRMSWNELEGEYESTGELIGYQCLGTDGKVLGYGEDPESALQAGYEALWGDYRDGESGMPPASSVVAR